MARRHDEITDGLSFVRELVRSTLWDIRYHERLLPQYAAEVKFAKKLLERAGVDYVARDNDDSDDRMAENIEQFASKILDETIDSLRYHETALACAHNEMAFVHSILARGDYTEIDVAEIKATIEKELEERGGRPHA